MTFTDYLRWDGWIAVVVGAGDALFNGAISCSRS